MAPAPTLKMRKLTDAELGGSRLDIVNALACSADPSAGIVYPLDMEPFLETARLASERYARKITFAHVLNKLIAVAIDENPAMNQVVLGNSVYQIEGIHLTNAFLLPGKAQALGNFILHDPHKKTLAEIQQETLMLMVEKTRLAAKKKGRLELAIPRLILRYGLNRLVSEKAAFTLAFNNNIITNIILSNHDYGGPARFYAVKPVIPINKSGLRIHACALGLQPFVDKSGAVVSREMLNLTVIGDHRTVDGVGAYRFGQSLRRIEADPEKYLL